jgi:hypothetical protein
MARDDFPQTVKTVLAHRVAMHCSNPSCRKATSGPHSDPSKAINVGVASHISAASKGGPRFDPSSTSAERCSIENAIWLCQICAKLVDNDPMTYSVGVLRRWKVTEEAKAQREVGGAQSDYFPQPPAAMHVPIPRIAGLAYDDARQKLVDAGWQAATRHWSDAADPALQYGNGKVFWDRGYREIINAWPTGLAQCTFGFHDVYGTKLVIVTVGEVDEDSDAQAFVWSWHFVQAFDEA